MQNKMYLRLIAVTIMLIVSLAGGREAGAALADLGPPIDPHGFPAFYSDTAGLVLEPCLPPPAGNAALRPDLCVSFPVDTSDPNSVALGVADEIFFWSAEATAPSLVPNGRALLVLALEGAFSTGGPLDGQQITFGRVRIRIDVPVAGTYTVIHPFGTQTFTVTDVAAGINFTGDIGAINTLNPILGFSGTLGSAIGPFLTWPNYLLDETLQARAIDPATNLPTGPALEQYVGNPNIPHAVTGSPTGNNLFRIRGPNGIDVRTTLFNVMGKVYDPAPARTAHVFPAAPPQKLFAVGPVNRPVSIDAVPVPGVVAGAAYSTGYPEGYPQWYQEALTVLDASGNPVIDPLTNLPQQTGGLQLTLCPATDPMCISAPIDPADPASVALRAGDESFYASADAFLDDKTTDAVVPPGLNGLLVLSLEAAFDGTGVPQDGGQIVFGRVRIRLDTPVAGTYRVVYPYGEELFENVPAGVKAVNITRDIMVADPANPDSAFAGALFSDIGPQFLKWTTFNPDPLLNDPALNKLTDPANPLTSPVIQYLGDPAISHAVTGSPNDTNYFRVIGPNGIDVQTSLFAVTGKVFDPATFAITANAAAPVANPDSAALNLAQAAAVTISVLANDTLGGAAIDPAAVTVAVQPAGALFGPAGGTASVNANGTVTYTANAGFAGSDTFAYQVTETATGLISANAIVTVTVTPVETLAVSAAQLDLRKLQLNIKGTSNANGNQLTIFPGAATTGTPIGTALVSGGKWQFRGTATTNLTSISIVSSTGKTLLNQPVQIR